MQLDAKLRRSSEGHRDHVPRLETPSNLVPREQQAVLDARATARTVSVIVPNYNYARYLNQRLASIQAQTHRIHEIILLDDASTDNSLSIIAELKQQFKGRLNVIVNPENSGAIAHQWARGVNIASGDLVWIAEADDLADDGFLAATVRAFDDNDVVLSYCQSRHIDGVGAVLQGDYSDYLNDFDSDRWKHDYCHPGTQEIADVLCVGNTIPNISGVVFKRTAIAHVLDAHRDELSNLRIAADWCCYLHLLCNGSIAYTALTLNSHRHHQHSVRMSVDGLCHLREIQQMQRLAESLVEVAPDRAIAARLWYAAWAEIVISTLSS